MHILFFSHYFPPEGNAPASRTYEHCVRWVQAGHRVTVVTCAPNVPSGVVYEGYRNRLWPQHEAVDGIDVIRVWTWMASNAGTVRRILNFVSYMVTATLAVLFQPRPDLVLATSPQFFCGWAGVIVSWLKWRPFVLEVRDIWPESIVTVGAMDRGWLIRGLERLEKWLYRSADHIVAVGNGYRDKILEKVDCSDRISVITNGVDVTQYVPRGPDPDFVSQWGLGGRFVCSYVGTIGMAHGLEVVPEAAKILAEQDRHDIAFLLVGDGADRAHVQQRVDQLGVSDYVTFTGRLPKSQMQCVLATSQALLIHLDGSELFETVIPSKIFESMAMERPLIMGVRGDARRIVDEAGAGIEMEPGNAESLVEAVTQLADDREFARRLGEAGRPFVEKNYSRDVLADRMLEVLLAVADGCLPRRGLSD